MPGLVLRTHRSKTEGKVDTVGEPLHESGRSSSVDVPRIGVQWPLTVDTDPDGESDRGSRGEPFSRVSDTVLMVSPNNQNITTFCFIVFVSMNVVVGKYWSVKDISHQVRAVR